MSETSDTIVNAINKLKEEKDALSTKKKLLDDLNARLGAFIKGINERDCSVNSIKKIYSNFTQQVIDYSFGFAITCLYNANSSVNHTTNDITSATNKEIKKVKEDRDRINTLVDSINTQISNIDIKITDYENELKKETEDNN